MVTYITAQYRHVVVCSGLYPVRSQSLHGVTLQDALKAQCSLLPRRIAVERLCIMSYKMTVHVILSYSPWNVPTINCLCRGLQTENSVALSQLT